MIRVRVPGSSANLGPGFDCFGVAWQCYNEIYFERQSEGVLITGCPEQFQACVFHRFPVCPGGEEKSTVA